MKRVIAFLCSLMFVILCSYLWIHAENKAERCTVEALATVTDVYRSGSTNSGQYNMELCYEVGDQTITQVRKNRSSRASTKIFGITLVHTSLSYEKGDTIEIYYNPDNIDEYVIKDDDSSKLGYLIGIVLASLMIVGTIVKRED